jgi:hypothetical protein
LTINYKRGFENEANGNWKDHEKSFYCHAHLLRNPIGYNFSALIYGNAGFMGALCHIIPLPPYTYPDNAAINAFIG